MDKIAGVKLMLAINTATWCAMGLVLTALVFRSEISSGVEESVQAAKNSLDFFTELFNSMFIKIVD